MFRKSLLLATTALTVASSLSLSATAAFAQQEEVMVLDEIIVTGSYIRRKSQADSPNPIAVFSSEDLDALGASNVAEIVQTLTINNGAQNNPDAFTQNGTTGTSNFNLRGLGVASTLVLLNGRRQVVSGALTNGGITFVDTASLIPQIAIGRIEILKDGAAATYGSDAVAGVVNFIADDSFEGVALSAEYKFVTDQGSASDTQIQGKFGWGTDNLHLMAAISYLDRTPLTTAERRLSEAADDASSLGNPGSFFATGGGGLPTGVPFIDPTGCEEHGGLPLVLGGDIPIGPLSLTPGLCRFDFGDYYNLIPKEERVQAYAALTYDVSDSISFRLEGGYSRNDIGRNNSPSFPFLQLGSAVVLASHPEFPLVFTLAGEPAMVNFGRAIGNGGAPQPNKFFSETKRISAALTGTTESGINWDLAITHARNQYDISTGDTITCRFQQALFGVVGQPDCLAGSTATAPGAPGSPDFFNPFASSFTTAPNSQEILDYVNGTQIIETDSRVTVYDAVVSGDLLDMPAGPLGLALGVQIRDEEWGRYYDDISNADGFAFLIGNNDFADTRTPWAVFAEAAVPLAETLDLSLAIRYEDYGGTIGSTLDPKVALLYRPNDELAIRASFSTAFRAPSIFQQFGVGTSLQQVVEGGASFFVAVRSLLDDVTLERDLLPETSEAYNVGVTWTPDSGVNVSLDYWRYDFKDVIIGENSQAVVDALGDDPDRVRRVAGPGSPILMVMVNFVNASSVSTDGIDFAISYTADTDMGTIRPSLEATYVLNYDIEDPLAGSIEGAGSRNFSNFGSPTPEWRVNAGLNWQYGSHSVNAYVRHIDSMTDDQTAGNTVGSMTTVDAQYNLSIHELIDNVEATVLTIGVMNAFDKTPPYVSTNGGFESRTHDPRGRVAYIKLSTKF